jgi:hypothetical protein
MAISCVSLNDSALGPNRLAIGDMQLHLFRSILGECDKASHAFGWIQIGRSIGEERLGGRFAVLSQGVLWASSIRFELKATVWA